MSKRQKIVSLCIPLLVAACATPPHTPPSLAALAPSQWYAPMPHGGNVADLSQWWRQQGDPVLAQLIEAAQAASPSLASARARIEEARAARVAAGAALLPALDASVSVSRGSAQPPLPMGTTSQAGFQSAWEIDLFGAGRFARDAAQSRLESAAAGWHDARVSVAAETANLYYTQRACEKLLAIALSDAASRAETARLAELSRRAGFMAPGVAALAQASAAEAAARTTQQRAQCEAGIKALVALTALSETELRGKVATPAEPAAETMLSIASLPAQVLSQRPDVFAAEREVAAASAEAGSAQAQRFPRLSLTGSVGRASFRTGGADTELSAWSIGPLALTLPVFDGGRRTANVDAAEARYKAAVAAYRASVRQAVREVEEALIGLHSTAARSDDVRRAVAGYRASFEATEARYKSGLTSLVELEEARRNLLAAENTQVSLERERRAAWVGLYRAAGGGWTAPADTQR